MNTVGKQGRLGEQIRCVVSVSMLTEGWDTNTVTHILGVRAFGTQLLCEQVVGRGLRRQSYELNEEGLFDVEYADILGIPFDFTAKPVVAIAEAAEADHARPRGQGARGAGDHLSARRGLSRRTAGRAPAAQLHRGLAPDPDAGGGRPVQGAAGRHCRRRRRDRTATCWTTSGPARSRSISPSICCTRASAITARSRRCTSSGRSSGSRAAGSTRAISSCKGGTVPAMVTYREMAEKAAERIYLACQRTEQGEKRIKAILDPYNPKGSTRHVSFITSKTTYRTAPDKVPRQLRGLRQRLGGRACPRARKPSRGARLRQEPGLQFEVPYRDGGVPRKYIPDFIVQVDDGHDDPLNLVLETKGYRGGDAQLKAETMRTLWVPGVNNLGTFGRWRFEEFTDVFEIEAEFAAG